MKISNTTRNKDIKNIAEQIEQNWYDSGEYLKPNKERKLVLTLTGEEANTVYNALEIYSAVDKTTLNLLTRIYGGTE